MNKLARGLATAAVASALIIAPAAAASATATYVPGAPAATVTGTPAAGATVTVNFGAGTFAPNEPVNLVLTGQSAANATLASTKVLVKNSAADGSLAAAVTLPSNAAGTYVLTATQGSIIRTQTIVVPAADAAAPGGLANTGADSAAAFWFAGGLLALGATTVVTLNVVRRNRAQA